MPWICNRRRELIKSCGIDLAKEEADVLPKFEDIQLTIIFSVALGGRSTPSSEKRVHNLRHGEILDELWNIWASLLNHAKLSLHQQIGMNSGPLRLCLDHADIHSLDTILVRSPRVHFDRFCWTTRICDAIRLDFRWSLKLFVNSFNMTRTVPILAPETQPPDIWHHNEQKQNEGKYNHEDSESLNSIISFFLNFLTCLNNVYRQSGKV